MGRTKKKETVVDDVFPPDDIPEVQVDALDSAFDDPDDEGLAFPEGTIIDAETGEITEPRSSMLHDDSDVFGSNDYTYEVVAKRVEPEAPPKNPKNYRAEIELEHLILDERLQPRSLMNQSLVDEYMEDIADGDTFPPVEVIEVNDRFYLTDGWHRVAAFRALSHTTVLANVTPGNMEQAILASSGANASHGLRRTNADKRRSVIRLLTTDTLASLSDSALAKAAKVSVRYVGIIRQTLEDEGEIPEVTNRIGVDGKVRDTEAFQDAITAQRIEQPKDPIKDVPSEFDNPDDPNAYVRPTEGEDDSEYISLEDSAAIAAFDRLSQLLLHTDVDTDLLVRMAKEHRREQYTLLKERFGALQDFVDEVAQAVIRDTVGL